MTRDAYFLLSGVISETWRLFTQWTLPGTNATPAEMAMFLATAVITLKFFLRVGQVNATDAHNSK